MPPAWLPAQQKVMPSVPFTTNSVLTGQNSQKKANHPNIPPVFFTMRREKEHLLSTSNHNSSLFIGRPPQVELYLLSTSNHTPCAITLFVQSVELYLLPTSNHNQFTDTSLREELSYIFFLHQTTTYATYIIHYQLVCCFLIGQ